MNLILALYLHNVSYLHYTQILSSVTGKGTHSIQFRELKPERLEAIRKHIGIREWETEPAAPSS